MPLNNKSIIKGTYLPPGDKSISHRILILTGQIVGKSKIKNLLQSEDVINTLKAMRLLGVKIINKTNVNIIYLSKINRELEDSKNIIIFFLSLVIIMSLTLSFKEI